MENMKQTAIVPETYLLLAGTMPHHLEHRMLTHPRSARLITASYEFDCQGNMLEGSWQRAGKISANAAEVLANPRTDMGSAKCIENAA